VKLQQLLIDELRDLYSAETQLISALPKTAKGASTEPLRNLIETHLEETRGQVERLKQIFDELKEKPGGVTCKAMQGLVAEGSEQLEKKGDEVGDLAITGACVRVEHYEMAAYSSTIALAKGLGHDRIASLLEETLNQEKEAAKKLVANSKPLIEQTSKASGGDGAKHSHSATVGHH
jgi:ferritin-like metal-binding protein YciE